ncbi:sensor domain-containing phosphodiesterase [Pullulanibacillus sp. KACC 23026]|uniref:sensor domain-containing phosphodiesterase n=1 Tax=Pullulanibacillus sp. KACC 23026 TaxID=3028315 RepID=UPI0023B095D5|nr:sensor domain-containing phosphodiesterase [Pullulanibacillus sp. KACC 23026]WEG12316.1 sensor domain-containing phosphodiesterase [Pullulanibacillus sp. KACC 23026]
MEYEQDHKYMEKLDQIMDDIVKLLPNLIPLNTFFVASNDGGTEFIIKAFNRHKELVADQGEVPYKEIRQLVVEQGGEPVAIDNLSESSSLINQGQASSQFEDGAFIGVPIWVNKTELFGTLCAIDEQPYSFSDNDIRLLKTFGNLLSQAVTLEDRMIRDPMTGLYNRQFVQTFLDTHLQEGHPIALLFIEFNRFKRINEVFGHLKGDQVLKMMANRVKDGMDSEDFVARFTGDKFIVVIKGTEARVLSKEVPRIGNHLLKLIREPFRLDHQEIQMQANIGIAFYPEDGSTVDSLLKNAESSLDLVRDQGGDTLSYFQPFVISSLFSELKTENELRLSINQGDFKLFFQPQIDLMTRKLVGFEALVRWHHPKRGIVLPNDFISIAEASGIIFSLGEWVFKKVCEVKQHWDRLKYPPVKLGVNLSPRQFQDPHLFNRFKKVIDDYQVDPSHLSLEITESLVMKDMEQSMSLLNQFKDMGFGISIDDFGKGYSSLAYLRALPIDTLKIDREFVVGLEESEDAKPIIKAIIGMANALDLKIIAEGIEKADQDRLLVDYGCHWGQGYYYSKPIPEENILAYFDQQLHKEKQEGER